jgi:hypothetical protein
MIGLVHELRGPTCGRTGLQKQMSPDVAASRLRVLTASPDVFS